VQIEWSLFAVEDRTRIFDYIEQEDPLAAVAVDERIMEQTATLSAFPECGRPGRVEGTRELVINHTSFIVAYRVQNGIVRVLRILHGAQYWPKELEAK
jgi:toxin ParE1/3/4